MAIFAEVAEAGVVGGLDGGDRFLFGDGDEGDFGVGAVGFLASFSYPFLEHINIFGHGFNG